MASRSGIDDRYIYKKKHVVALPGYKRNDNIKGKKRREEKASFGLT